MSHTAGPWEWEDDSWHRLIAPDGKVIDYANYEGMWLSRYDRKEDAANARLIAAAPDLLAALKAILGGDPSCIQADCKPGCATCAAARAAIAKAQA